MAKDDEHERKLSDHEYGPLSDLLDEIVTVLKEEEELWDADEIDPAIPTARAKVEAYWETLIAEAKAQGAF